MSNSLDQALAQATERYRARNPASEQHMQAASDVLPAGNTRSVLFHGPFPLYMARGERCRLRRRSAGPEPAPVPLAVARLRLERGTRWKGKPATICGSRP